MWRSIGRDEMDFFREEGYLVLENLISPKELQYYDRVYDDFLFNRIETSGHRSDLSGGTDFSREKITQIMLPSKFLPELKELPIHGRTLQIARELLGTDMDLDFDMLINKSPLTNTPTPWHQDAAYWIDMPDRRAVSCWVAIDRAFKENGCMWYIPKSHRSPVLPHVQTGNKGALQCEGSEARGVCIPLEPGSCVLHQGGTLHYSRGNSTLLNRRAVIVNYRPSAMIRLERSRGVDHSGERKAKL